MIRAAFPAPRRLRKADRLRIFARAGGKCQCDGAVCALAAFGGDLAAFDQAITDRARRRGSGYPSAFAWARGLGFEPTEPLWHVDHVIPLWAGGSNEDSNLRLLAAPCHRRITAEQAGQRGRASAKKLASVRRLPCVDGGFEDGRCTGCGRGFEEHRRKIAAIPRHTADKRGTSRWPKGRAIASRAKGSRIDTRAPSSGCRGSGRRPRQARLPDGSRATVCRVCGAPVTWTWAGLVPRHEPGVTAARR